MLYRCRKCTNFQSVKSLYIVLKFKAYLLFKYPMQQKQANQGEELARDTKIVPLGRKSARNLIEAALLRQPQPPASGCKKVFHDFENIQKLTKSFEIRSPCTCGFGRDPTIKFIPPLTGPVCKMQSCQGNISGIITYFHPKSTINRLTIEPIRWAQNAVFWKMYAEFRHRIDELDHNSLSLWSQRRISALLSQQTNNSRHI